MTECPIFTDGIVAVNNEGEIIHFCAYVTEPTEKDYENLKIELKTDPQFNITEEFELVPCPLDLFDEYCDMIAEAYEDGTITEGPPLKH